MRIETIQKKSHDVHFTNCLHISGQKGSDSSKGTHYDMYIPALNQQHVISTSFFLNCNGTKLRPCSTIIIMHESESMVVLSI